MAAENPTVVLLHGTWLGGWVWEPVLAALARKGLHGFAPTLIGLGERAGEGDETIGLSAQVEDAARQIAAREDERLVFVGHSYGGAIAAALAAREQARTSAVLLFDAFVTVAGRSIYETHPFTLDLMKPLVDPARPGFIQPVPPAALGIADANEAAAFAARMTPQAERGYTEAATVSAADLDCPTHYLRCSDFPLFADTAAEAQARGWTVGEISGGHMAPVFDPEQATARIIDAIRG
jgi:pimeloyl-ACP methyl ester carboxylesterase